MLNNQGDPSKRSNRKNRTTFSDDPHISGVFQLDELKKRFPFTFQPKYFRNFVANGKQQVSHKTAATASTADTACDTARDTARDTSRDTGQN